MGYPLVPGYESVGRVVEAGSATALKPGQRVFVPGAKCFGEVRGLFGASASRLVVAEKRVVPLDQALGDRGILLALAATAYHAIAAPGAVTPQCIVGHGVLGRLLARISIALGNEPPVVWEKNPARSGGGIGYGVLDPEHDPRRDYKSIYDVSGDPGLLDSLIGRIAWGGAFMREARLRVAAEWQPPDLTATKRLIESGKLSLEGLITHHFDAQAAPDAYRVAFEDPACLKMVLNWSSLS
jgi:3-hydroxyethyl bacteriochlorophyllide a dehydrogenase